MDGLKRPLILNMYNYIIKLFYSKKFYNTKSYYKNHKIILL